MTPHRRFPREPLREIPIIDNHCHPFTSAEIGKFDAEGLDARLTHRGTMAIFEQHLYGRPPDNEEWTAAARLAATTILTRSAIRWLAEHFDCPPTREAVLHARDVAMTTGSAAYAAGLLHEEHVEAVLEAGRPLLPAVERSQFAAAIGTQVYSVARTDSWIEEHSHGTFDDLVSGFQAAAGRAASDPECVAFKSLIAYHAGLDIKDPTAADAAAAFDRWKAAGRPFDRGLSKPVFDFLFHQLLRLAAEHDRPVHIHCEATTPWLFRSHPFSLWGVLAKHPRQAFVLIHGGHPWIIEAATMAARLPNLWVDISGTVPWGWSAVDWALEMYLGHLSWTQILYGSDGPGYDPESLWLSARMAREALGRVLARLCDQDHIVSTEVPEIGAAILGANCRVLHGLG